MSTAISFDAFERCLDPVFALLSKDQQASLIDLRGDVPLQQRMAELFSKSNEGELTDDERAEYEGYVRANLYLATVQSRIRKQLRDQAD